MFLKSLTINGFKSFPERTGLEFSPGVSVIIGPNGSGKSNITDAVLWALGEQSPGAVRGMTMQDVISEGGGSMGARSSAEVEVVFEAPEGSDFSEISISRRLTRDGEGEYRLNGARCRLVDVIEVLSDANLGKEMHSVISQGQVDSIVGSKPAQRRLLIEEAAGLGKFRRRRRRSELKLKATRENLSRALDVEREAKRALRPLKEQANAAEIGAKIEREELGLKARIIAEEIRFGQDRLEAARGLAEKARGRRSELEKRLGEVSKRRTAAEERFADRDRLRTELWETLNDLRGAREQVHLATVSISERGRSLEPEIELLRRELEPLSLDLEGTAGEPDRARRLVDELGAVEVGLGRASRGLEQAGSEGSETDRLAGLAEVHAGTQEAQDHARRAESLLGERHRERLGERLGRAEALQGAISGLAEAATGTAEALASRIETAELVAVGSDAEEAHEHEAELRTCSDEAVQIQADHRTVAEEVTEAEVEAAQLENRRAERVAEIARIESRLGEPLQEAGEPMDDEERETIERRLEALARRRERIGPVNPLAQREYEEAQEHHAGLVEQREDSERALRELEDIIREIDTEMSRSFEQTFDAAAANFEQVIAHLFPGGSGKLKKVELEGPVDPESEATDPEGEPDGDEVPAPGEPKFGVELEVTPKGKKTRQMRLLSGGEKALTALGFVFAVFLARPCPFYILDAVEAALDDANIARFLELVGEFSTRTQFIIVTHQKLTMDAADVLYGASMGGDGITRVVSRRLPPARVEESGVEERLDRAA
ncbi:MAG: chromosome segregation SMC family protein [Solirubrobacterales bacterium]